MAAAVLSTSRIAWLGGPVDPDAGGAFQGLCVGAAGAFDYSHVILEGVGARVDLDVFHLRAILAQVFVERDEARLVRVNELDLAWHALLLAFEPVFPDLAGRGEDE
jgi:hypothetical protein